MPLFTNPVISLGTEENDERQRSARYLSEGLDEFAVNYYENTVKDFLNDVVSSTENTMEITGVSTSIDLSILSTILPQRRLKRSDKSNFDLNTGILGKYNPPPEVQFDNLIQDSIDTYSDILISKLNEYPTFSNVQSIKAEFSNVTNVTQNNTVEIKEEQLPSIPEDEGKGMSGTTIIIIIFSVVGLWICVIVLVCAIKRTKKRNFSKEEEQNIMNLPIPASIDCDNDKPRARRASTASTVSALSHGNADRRPNNIGAPYAHTAGNRNQFMGGMDFNNEEGIYHQPGGFQHRQSLPGNFQPPPGNYQHRQSLPPQKHPFVLGQNNCYQNINQNVNQAAPRGRRSSAII